MESESSSAQNGGRTTWTPPMDQLFIELMVEQVLEKQLLDGQFSKSAWVNIVTKFKDSFGPSYNKEVLRNCMKTLKKSFNIVSSIRGTSGFGWNKTREIATAPDDEHPEYRQWRTRSLPHYDDLAMIFGDSRATGKHRRFRNDNNQDNHEDDEEGDNNTQEQNENVEDQNDNDNMYGNGNISDDNTSEMQTKMRTSVGSSYVHLERQKKSTGEGMVEAINLMASVVNNIATKKEENRNSFLEKNVVTALEEMPNLDDFLFMQYLDLLEDEKKAKIFIALSGDRRRSWLLSKLNYSDYY
ncbi:L10-interacting MYB domain-containing protein-like [Papaver somniferum]|uniref:L10-interacting MYB domain-containing protein-like n=1 Tax=Papaver somniferum TaxID=3469 RepID=UPI000E6FD1F9|nr:L10-interacting MYB domain-containing protein-like [Papaver somniferum]